MGYYDDMNDTISCIQDTIGVGGISWEVSGTLCGVYVTPWDMLGTEGII